MRIQLTNFNATPESSINIYRSYDPFEENNLPAILVTVPADTEEYLDETVAVNTVVYYRFGIVHNAVEIIGPMYTTIKRYYSGVQSSPLQPDAILRGDSKLGRYGAFPADAVIPHAEILSLISGSVVLDGVDLADVFYEKCIYEGNVLFLPSQPFLKCSLYDLYVSKALLSRGPGNTHLTQAFWTSIDPRTEQGLYVTKGSSTYRIRAITWDEYHKLHVMLYPSTALGADQYRSIANLPGYNHPLPLVTASQGQIFRGSDLDGMAYRLDFYDDMAQYLVLELMSESNMNLPDPEVIVVPYDGLPPNHDGVGAYVKGKFHVLGGVPKTDGSAVATNQHVAFDESGGGYMFCAGLVTGVLRPANWVYNDKIYCFGGVTTTKTDSSNYLEKTDILQVWEDDGTGAGTWSTMLTNAVFSPGAIAMVYDHPTTGKPTVMIAGGDTYQDQINAKRTWTADLETFDGQFIEGTLTTASNVSNGTYFQYRGEDYLFCGHTSFSYVAGGGSTLDFPTTPGGPLVHTYMKTNGGVPLNYYGHAMVWHDAAVMLGYLGSIGESTQGKFVLHQFLPDELRCEPLTIQGLGNYGNRLTMASNDGVFFVYCSDGYNGSTPPKIIKITLRDPLDADLLPIDTFDQVVDRLFHRSLNF